MRVLKWCARGVVVCLLGGVLGAAQGQALEDIQWLSEEYAPYNYADPETGIPTGISVDVLQRIWDRLGVERQASDITILPWARGYRIAQDDPNTCLFATTVTEPRQELFNFVEPLVDVSIVVVGARDGAPAINSVDDLAPYRIGVVRDDIGDQLLVQQGAESTIIRTDSARIMVRMLRGQRFDFIAYDAHTARWTMQQEDIDASEYADVYVLDEAVMGYACNKAVPQEYIDAMQSVLDELIADGTVARIISEYRQ